MKKITLLLSTLILLGNIVTAQVDLKKGLYLDLPLDQSVKDNSGNKYDFTVKRAGSWATNRFGKDSNTAFVSHKDSTWLVRNNFTMPTDFTISVWVKPFSDNQQSIILNLGNSALNGFGITMSDGNGSSGNKLLITANGKAYDLTGSTETLTKNTWQHIIVIRKSGKFYLYKDTILNSSATDITDPDNGVLNIANSIEQIGAGGKAFDGAIDDIKIYNRAVSDSEIVALNKEKLITTNILADNFDSDLNIDIYPNPVNSNNFSIKIPEGNDLDKLEFVNIAGQLISTELLLKSNQNYLVNIPSSTLPGIYFARIRMKDREIVKKVIVQ